MLLHFIKIAFRNLWKYKSQTLISILGLAVGFTCFALSTLWIVHEMTYDSFHANAKQLYVVYKPDFTSPSGYNRRAMNPLGTYLKESFPEIADATSLIQSPRRSTVRIDEMDVPAMLITVDSSFFKISRQKFIGRALIISLTHHIRLVNHIHLFGILGETVVCHFVTNPQCC